MMAPHPKLSFGALALVVSLAVPMGFLSLVSQSTTGEQVDAADLVVVARVAALQFVEEPSRTIVELAVDHEVFGHASGPSISVAVDGRSSLEAGDTIVALLGHRPTELLGAYQVRKDPRTLESKVVSDVTGMMAQGVRGGGVNDPLPLDIFELGVRARRGLPAGSLAQQSGAASGAPKGVTVLPDAYEPNNSLGTRTTVTGLHPPTLVTGHPLVLSGLPVPDTYMGLFDANPPGELLTTDDDSGHDSLSQFTYLFEKDGPIAVAVESALDPANLFDGSTGTTEGYYQLSLEFKLGSFLGNGLDTLIGVSPDGTFIEDMVGYKFTGGDDVLLRGIVPADAWALDYDAQTPMGVTHVYGGAGEQTTDPGFLNAVAPVSFELGAYQSPSGVNRRGLSQAVAMLVQSSAPDRGITVTHKYTLPLFDRTLKGDLALQIATDDAITDLVYSRVMHVDLFEDGGDTFFWSFDPNSPVKAFAIPANQNVGNYVIPSQPVAREVDVDRQFAIVIDNGNKAAGSFGEVRDYKLGFTLIEGFSTAALAYQEAVRRLTLGAGATSWVVAVDQDPTTLMYAAFGAGVGQ